MKNSIKIGVLTLAIVSTLSVGVKAQNIPSTGSTTTSTTTGSGIRLSVGPDAGVPVGSLKDNYNWALGGSIEAEFPIVKNQVYVTVNSGYLDFFSKNDNGFSNTNNLGLIPAKAGLKFFLIQGLYIQGEAGASFLTNKSDVGATKSTAFVYAPSVGYLIPLGGKNYLDAGVRFESNTKFTDDGNTNNFFALRAAYSFGL
jgi:hypothetical protein